MPSGSHALKLGPKDWLAPIELALREDLGLAARAAISARYDVTTQTCLEGSKQRHERMQATLLSKDNQPLVVCGLPLIAPCFRALGGRKPYQVKIRPHVEDGDLVAPGADIALLRAPAEAMLGAERTILNFLRHLSAIATLTAHFIEAVRGTSVRILDTRKTTPGLRSLERYAVRCGGGENHRFGLQDAILIKNNHVDLAGGLDALVPRLPKRKKKHSIPVIVEVRNPEELETVVRLGRDRVTRILFDNFEIPLLRESVARAAAFFQTEASGGISLENARAYAETGVQFLSVGQITHCAGSVDLALHFSPRAKEWRHG